MSDPYWTPSTPGDGSNIVSSADVIASGGDPGIVAGSTSGGGVNLFADNLSDALSGSPMDQIMQAADFNNRWSAQQAAITRSWQESQNEKAMQFSAEQAALNRTWQEEMSNTAHQREVRDLQAAGLNPVLSATGGNGASVGSGAAASGVTSAGATGQTDNSSTGAITSYLAQMLAAQTSILNTQTSAQAQLAQAQLMSQSQLGAAQLSAAATTHMAELQHDAAMHDPVKLGVDYLMQMLNSSGLGPSDAGNIAAQLSRDSEFMDEFISSKGDVWPQIRQIAQWFMKDPFGFNKRWYIDDGWVHLVSGKK